VCPMSTLIATTERTAPIGSILCGMDECDECGFRYTAVPVSDLRGHLEMAGPRYAAGLSGVADPRRRPAPSVWSPLEYTCHVRDVLRVQAERVALALRVDSPEFAPMGRDERVIADAYNAQDPQRVVAELTAAAHDLADALDALSPQQWDRTGIYPWPSAEPRTILWLGRHTVHELEHHLMDLTR
jgi:hypothetical protein